MWSKIPILGWVLALSLATFSAAPFYYLWNYIAPKYLATEIPVLYLHLPFWDIVCIFLTISIIKDRVIGSSFKGTIENNIKN